MADSKKVDNRFRNWATVFYPESCPDNYLDIITEWKVPCYLSPLHEKDVNANGEPKKAHFHLILAFEAKQSKDSVEYYTSQVNSVGLERVKSLRGYCRYLCHLDNPEKAQYSVSDVRCFAGADIYNAVDLPSDRYAIIRDIIQFCSDNGIFLYCDLLEYCMTVKPDWFRVLCDSGTYVIKEYLKSVTFKMKIG